MQLLKHHMLKFYKLEKNFKAVQRLVILEYFKQIYSFNF